MTDENEESQESKPVDSPHSMMAQQKVFCLIKLKSKGRPLQR